MGSRRRRSFGPETVTLDLLDHTLAFCGADEERGRAWLDGVPFPMRVALTQSDCISSSIREAVDDGRGCRLLVSAIAAGAPRILVEDGFEIDAAMLPRDNRVTATLRVGPEGLRLDLEHYVD